MQFDKMQKEKRLTSSQFIIALFQHNFSLSDLKHLLESKHQNLDIIFQAIRNHPRYYHVAKQLLQDMIGNMYKMVNEKLQIHIVHNIWKHQYLFLIVGNQHIKQQDRIMFQTMYNQEQIYMHILMFLCQKMRSLKFQIRIAAIKSFSALIQNVIQLYKHQNQFIHQKYFIISSQAIFFDRILTKIVKNMLKKQQLVKIVSFSQGLFLQLLEDEYQQIRTLTLATLQLIALKTPYFYTQLQKGKNESIQTLKQMILYMLNDQHEIVRQKSLTSISNISLAQYLIDDSFQVFSLLSRQQISTILMCLKQNNINLRQKAYECLKCLKINSIQNLLLILQKLYQTLIIYKQDKIKIYGLLKQYSLKYHLMIRSYIYNINSTQSIQNNSNKINEIKNNSSQQIKNRLKILFDYNNEEQPNCKNIIYKGKLLLLREIIIIDLNNQNYKKIWPNYVKRHLLYVQHIQNKISNNVIEQFTSNTLSQMNQQQDQIFYNIQQNQYTKITNNLQKLKSILQLQMQLVQQNTFKYDFFQLLTIFTQSFRIKFNHIVSIQKQNEIKEQINSKIIEEIYPLINQNIKQVNKLKISSQKIQFKQKILFKINYIKFMYNLKLNTLNSSIYTNNFNKYLQQYLFKIYLIIQKIETLMRSECLQQANNQNDNIFLQQIFSLVWMLRYQNINNKRFNNFRIKLSIFNKKVLNQFLIISTEYHLKDNNMNKTYFQLLDQEFLRKIWIKVVPIEQKQKQKQSIDNKQYYINYFQLLKDSYSKQSLNTLKYDNQENKNILSVQLPLKILGSKFTNKSFISLQSNTKLSTGKTQNINHQKLLRIQGQQLNIKDLLLLFIHQNDKSDQDNINGKKDNLKVLAEWHKYYQDRS